jgi:hypothetical protein
MEPPATVTGRQAEVFRQLGVCIGVANVETEILRNLAVHLQLESDRLCFTAVHDSRIDIDGRE